jgi:hypothetical protein
LGVGMTKFENVGRRDGPGTGGKARKDVSILPPARLAYGMSPREWRHQANTRRSEPTGESINP